MDSGKRRRVMVACVTFDTVKISEPAKYYETPFVHLIHYVRDPGSKQGNIYQSFFEETSEQIGSFGGEVFEHNADVNSFPEMMDIVMQILQVESRKSPVPDVFVNISAGSSEYVAAAAIVSMMFPNAVPFAVRTTEYTVKQNMIKKMYFDNERPVGLAKSVSDPTTISKIKIKMPDERLVLALKVYASCNGCAKEVIQLLKETHLWIRDKPSSQNQEKYDSVYYHRDFVSRWIEEGWVLKDAYLNRYNLTDEGRRVLNTYYKDREFGEIDIDSVY